eukprot:scaffold39487_cov229-Amphora_coffeaeformis.AAC.1
MVPSGRTLHPVTHRHRRLDKDKKMKSMTEWRLSWPYRPKKSSSMRARRSGQIRLAECKNGGLALERLPPP